MPTFSAATACLLAAVLLGSAGCATPPVSPAPAPPAPPAPVAELAVDVFAPVEALLCVPVPLRFVVRNAGSQPVAGVHVHCELAEGLLAEDGRTTIRIVRPGPEILVDVAGDLALSPARAVPGP